MLVVLLLLTLKFLLLSSEAVGLGRSRFGIFSEFCCFTPPLFSETLSASSDKAKTELSSKLRQEFHKRKQATELVQQLQMDYDKLLSAVGLGRSRFGIFSEFCCFTPPLFSKELSCDLALDKFPSVF
jgi:hypothetical protein